MNVTGYPNNFGMLPESASDFKDCLFVVLPVPLENSTSYGKGTCAGPKAIIRASHNMELYDEEMELHAADEGICTLKPLCADKSTKDVLKNVEKQVSRIVSDKKIPVLLGGEHTVTIGAVRACSKIYQNLTVLHLDAHADLKDEYDHSKLSHACTLRRIRECASTVSAYVRSLDQEEAELIRNENIPVFFAHKIQEDTKGNWIRESISKLSEKVYVSIDVDCLDASLMPATGTPEPGGVLWHDLLAYLKAVALNRTIIGFDIVELSPRKGLEFCDYTAARLAYKLMTYIVSKEKPIRKVDEKKK